jgi:hypothetical protein
MIKVKYYISIIDIHGKRSILEDGVGATAGVIHGCCLHCALCRAYVFKQSNIY